MSYLEQSQNRTRTLARVLGPFLVIVGVTAVARASDMRGLVSQFTANPVLSWVTGAFYVGWISTATQPTSHAPGSASDLPRAA
jgi:hypothetical protein